MHVQWSPYIRTFSKIQFDCFTKAIVVQVQSQSLNVNQFFALQQPTTELSWISWKAGSTLTPRPLWNPLSLGLGIGLLLMNAVGRFGITCWCHLIPFNPAYHKVHVKQSAVGNASCSKDCKHQASFMLTFILQDWKY